MADIIFIGAGPIGLLAAIQLKLQFPIEIIMFEKYLVPQRNHAMYVQQSSFEGYDRSKGFAEVLAGIHSKVMISDLETTLRAFAEKIGIKIVYEEIKSFDELKAWYPETQYFVGSGGLKGIIHPHVFQNKNQINESIRYAIEVKYKAIGKTRALHKLTELTAVLANTKHVVSEYVGHLKEGLTPISLRIFVDKTTYESMKGATFKTPYTLDDKDKIPQDLYATIITFTTGRQCLASEKIQEDSLKISALTLSIYASERFCAEVDGKYIFQIGEEAFACPFYRSFNDNACCIPYFTKAMRSLLEHRRYNTEQFFKLPIGSTKPLECYQLDVQKLVDSEILTIHLLNTGLDMIGTTIATSQAIPQISSSKLMLTHGGREFLRDISKKQEEQEETSSCVIF